ncbi:hypothetical protein EDD15DRAFT_1674949 [Pisolithus albus]|nr:hypothetical protein EDD15DRAFT_1674949 [Pisolithus albus]
MNFGSRSKSGALSWPTITMVTNNVLCHMALCETGAATCLVSVVYHIVRGRRTRLLGVTIIHALLWHATHTSADPAPLPSPLPTQMDHYEGPLHGSSSRHACGRPGPFSERVSIRRASTMKCVTYDATRPLFVRSTSACVRILPIAAQTVAYVSVNCGWGRGKMDPLIEKDRPGVVACTAETVITVMACSWGEKLGAKDLEYPQW